APSCAKRSVVARPFPIPSPGLCPAPTITATLPSRRMAALLATGVQGCLYGASLRKSARASRIEGGRQILANRDYSTDKRHPVVFPLAMPPPLLLLQDIIVTFGVTP